MSDSVLSIAAIAIALASFAFNVVWNLAGRPEPLSLTNLRRPIDFGKRKIAERRVKRDRRERERIEREWNDEEHELASALSAAVTSVRDIKCGVRRVSDMQAKQMQQACKEFAVKYEKHVTKNPNGSLGPSPTIRNYDDHSVVITHGTFPFDPEHPRMAVHWHPDPDISAWYRFNSRWPLYKVDVLNEPLSTEDMRGTRWETIVNEHNKDG